MKNDFMEVAEDMLEVKKQKVGTRLKRERKEFLIAINEVMDEYHSSIYLIDGVFEGALQMLEAIKVHNVNHPDE
tara:strand:- start:244 stop:465 length:222 start_codon:yes stop_codon:yes gene_type:complete